VRLGDFDARYLRLPYLHGRAEDAAVVERLMRCLSEREREILRLRFEEDLTQAEIGDRLGVSQMHVSRLIRRSIATLQQAASVYGLRPGFERNSANRTKGASRRPLPRER